MHSSAVLSLLVIFSCEVAVGVGASVERDQSAHAQTVPQQAEFGSQTERLLFSLENSEQKARASRSRASFCKIQLLYYGTEWYASTAVR